MYKTRQLTEKNKELEKLSLVASKTDNSVIIADSNGEIEWVNDGFIRLIGMSKEVVIGKKLSEINVYSNVDAEIKDAIENKHSKIFQSNVTTHNLKNIWLSSTLTPIILTHPPPNSAFPLLSHKIPMPTQNECPL